MYRPDSVYSAGADARVTFIRKTYAHLAGAVGLFIVFSFYLYAANVGEAIMSGIGGGYGWLLILGGFVLCAYLAQSLARSDRPLGVQYLGLALFTFAESIVFSPLIFLAGHFAPQTLPTAALVTGITFAGLTGYTLLSHKDFSFMGGILTVIGFAALGFIIASVFFHFSMGTIMVFTAIMIVYAACSILYSTSNVMRYYRADQYVAAALDLFAAVAILFYYILMLLLETQRR